MHDYAMEARKEQEEENSILNNKPNDEESPDDGKSPQPGSSPNEERVEDMNPFEQPPRDPAEVAREEDRKKLEEEVKEQHVQFCEKINYMLNTQGGKVIALKEINAMRENLMYMYNLSEMQEKIGECDQKNPQKTHYHAMTSKHLYLVEQYVKKWKEFIYLKKISTQMCQAKNR
jgi:hypothetical protein